MKIKQAGFSLIEAIVALVILSLVFTAVWGWFGSAITSSAKIENAVALPRVFSQFTLQLELEDLASKNNGEYVIGDYQVQWQASVIKSSVNEAYRRQPVWIVTLYQVSASIWLKGREVDSVNTQIVQQRRDPDYIDPADFGL